MHGVWRESVTVVCRLGECRQELLDPYQRGSTRAAQYPLLSLSSPTTCYTLTHYTALHILNCINATNYYVQILMTLNTQCTNIREHCIKSEICFRTYYRRIVFIWCSYKTICIVIAIDVFHIWNISLTYVQWLGKGRYSAHI